MSDTRRGGQLPLELNCSDYQPKEQTFAPTPGDNGGLFSCSLGPLPQETMAALDRASQEHGRVRLLFGGHAVLLELVMLERRDARRVRIVGRVIKSATA